MKGKKVWTNYRQVNKTNVQYLRFLISLIRVFFNCFLALLLIAFLGCSVFSPPTDYYEKTLQMEESAKRSYKEPPSSKLGNTVTAQTQESTKVIRMPSDEPPIVEVITRSTKENIDGKSKSEIYETKERAQLPMISQETEIPITSSVSLSSGNENNSKLITNEPISVSSEVIKNALEIAGITVRSVELVNGRLEGGKNSVRVNFISESVKLVNERFFTICAVIYHLNKSSKTIDVVIGIAEDSQSNLLGALQSNMEDITAWMDNKITRAEWFSRIIRKML